MKRIKLKPTAEEAAPVIKPENAALIASIEAFLRMPLAMRPPQPKD
ncbi:hypothetical protein [Sphingobium xenophagum]|nr:hypothetical protein [Sphingobium xenophagum]QWT15338.1 hypothetical protein GTV57_06245 [Sphingobium xenophagum]